MSNYKTFDECMELHPNWSRLDIWRYAFKAGAAAQIKKDVYIICTEQRVKGRSVRAVLADAIHGTL